jgi:hypothetical protein
LLIAFDELSTSLVIDEAIRIEVYGVKASSALCTLQSDLRSGCIFDDGPLGLPKAEAVDGGGVGVPISEIWRCNKFGNAGA